MFQTQYNTDRRYPVSSGSRFKDEFQLVTEPDGNTHLEKSGTTDLYQEIQSHKDSCTIENIVRRALNGDLTALQQRQGVYGDARFDANDLIAANEAVKQAQSIYKALPAEKRAEFGSFDSFVKSFGTLDGINKLFTKPKNKEVTADAEPTA